MGVVREKKLEEVRTPKEVWTTVGFKCDGCGRQEEKPWPPWIPIRVEAGEGGGEGSQVVEKLYCDDCDVDILGALIALGFATHYHGSTNFLEIEDCPGFRGGECPTPQRARYGNVDLDEEAEWDE